MVNPKNGSPITNVGDDGEGNFFKVMDQGKEGVLGDEGVLRLGSDPSAGPQNDNLGGEYRNDKSGCWSYSPDCSNSLATSPVQPV